MKNKLLVLLVFIFGISAHQTNWFTDINGPLTDNATALIWGIFLVPIICLAAIPIVKAIGARHEVRDGLNRMNMN